MKTLLKNIPLVILFIITFSCQRGEEVAEKASPVVDVEADINAFKEAGSRYALYTNTGDFEQWLSLWTDDGVRMPQGSPARVGKEQIREELEPVFEQMILDLTITDVFDVKVFGDLGIVRCNYTLNATPKAGGETIHVMRDGKSLSLWKRQSDGSWQIMYDCINSNVPSTSE